MNFLKKNFVGFFYLAAVLFLTVPASSLFAWDDINIVTPTYSLANQAGYSNQTVVPDGAGYNDVIANGVRVYYNGIATSSVTGALIFDKNTLDLFNSFGFSQAATSPVAVTRFSLTNQANTYNNTVLPGTFSLIISNNILQAAKKDDTAYNNSHTLTFDAIKGNLYGAFVQTNNSDIGTVSLDKNVVNSILNTNKDMYGAQAILNITANNITLPSSALSVTANQVNIFNGTLDKNNIVGGAIAADVQGLNSALTLATPTVANNKITVTRGTFNETALTGGLLSVKSDKLSQTVNIGGTITGNQLDIKGGEYNTGRLIGGSLMLDREQGTYASSSFTSAVTGNTITISNGDFYNSLIVGGITASTNNTDTLSGVTLSGNTIEISGTANLDDRTWLAGGFTTGTNAYNNNTLTINKQPAHNPLHPNAPAVSVYGVDGFDTYNFDITNALNGDVYLSASQGNGHENALFKQFNLNAINAAWDVNGATVNWTTSDSNRPAGLTALGSSVTLMQETSGYKMTGTLANAGSTTNFTDSGITYTYQLLQSPSSVYVLLNNATGTTWNNGDINMTAGANSGDDVAMTISGTVTAPNITVASNSLADAALTAGTLDVTANDTALNLTAAKNAQKNATFTNININNHNLTKSGNAFYSFTNMGVTGTANISALDVVGTSTATFNSGANATIGEINFVSGGSLTTAGAGAYMFNTLNVYQTGNLTGTFTGNLTANSGQWLNFFINGDTVKNSTLLNVTGSADITGSNVRIGILDTLPSFALNDQLVLLNAAGGLTGTPATTGLSNVGLKQYQFDITTASNQLLATVTNVQLNENAKAFSEGRAVAAALVSQGGDFIAQEAITAAQQAADRTAGTATFGAIGGGHSRYKTGSHVDLTAFNAAVGLSHEIKDWYNADWLVGSFVEYGIADYDTFNGFYSGDVKGKGTSQYVGLGIMSKAVSQQNTYLEISGRIGRAETDFKGAVYSANDADYDYATVYYGAHAGLGYIWQWSEAVNLDLAAKYFWSHQGGKTVTVLSSDEIIFKDTDSSRARAGARFNFQLGEFWAPYVGAAYDYEFDGKAHATTYGMDIDAPGLTGGTAIAEAGLTYTGDALTVGIGGQGYAGKRRGASGHIRLGWAF